MMADDDHDLGSGGDWPLPPVSVADMYSVSRSSRVCVRKRLTLVTRFSGSSVRSANNKIDMFEVN